MGNCTPKRSTLRVKSFIYSDEELGRIVNNLWYPKAITSVHIRYIVEGSLEPLSKLENVVEITIDRSIDILDLEPLSNLTNLRKLTIRDSNIDNLEPLRKLVNLRELNLSGNRISDIGAIVNLVELEKLDVTYNPISDFEPLRRLVKLREFRLDITSAKLESNLRLFTKLWGLKKLNGYTGEIDFSHLDFLDSISPIIANEILKLRELDCAILNTIEVNRHHATLLESTLPRNYRCPFNNLREFGILGL